MPLVLAGATSGSTTIQATDATTQTITLPANSGTIITTASTPSFAGNISFSTADAGIVFNKTGALTNSTLNDYENGTFTPVIAFGGNSVGVTYLIQTGKYEKIGNFVHIYLYIVLTNKGSSTGSVTITGLPFTILNSTNLYPSAALWTNNLTGLTGTNQAYGTFGGTSINPEYTGSGAAASITNTNVANNSGFMVNLCYATS